MQKLYGAFLRLLMKASLRKLWPEWQRSLADPRAAQAERLKSILGKAAQTAYGCSAGITSGLSQTEYAAQVPVVDYADLAPWLERVKNGEPGVLTPEPVEMFATTSGTTGTPKFLPITRSMNLEQHRSHRIWMGALTEAHPRVPEGYFHTSFSPAEEGRTPGGIPFGSMSGKNYLNQPIPVRRKHAVPYAVCLLKSYEARHYATLAFALARELTIVTSVNPSTLCVLADRLRQYGGQLVEDLLRTAQTGRGTLAHCPEATSDELAPLLRQLRISRLRAEFLRDTLKAEGALRPISAWPTLQVLATWHGGSAPFYLSRLPDSWGNVPTRCLGLRASEGMFSVPLADRTAEAPLATWGHYLEFLPEDADPKRVRHTLGAHELAKGERYRMLITTSGGLCRYDLADVVEVTGFLGQTPTVAFLHRAGQVISVTGEKVTEEQAVRAFEEASRGTAVAGFSVTLRLSDNPRYLVAVEPAAQAAARGNGNQQGAFASVSAPVFAPASVSTNAPASTLGYTALNSNTTASCGSNWQNLRERFDSELAKQNLEYEAKRKSGRLALPDIMLLPAGTYDRYRRRLVESGRPEGQIKPPHFFKREEDLQERLLQK